MPIMTWLGFWIVMSFFFMMAVAGCIHHKHGRDES